ncbi:MAG: exo-alpha-sialidase, partial [Flavitalea sp.]
MKNIRMAIYQIKSIKQFKSIYTFLLAMIVFASGCSPKMNAISSNGITVTSMSPVAPIFKGVDLNPVIRVRIHLPAGQQESTLNKLFCTINEAALSDIEKLELYGGGQDPLFDSKKRIAEYTPSSTSFEMPLAVSLKPGLNYVWISATLKPSANMDHKVELHVKSLADNKGKNFVVAEDNTSFEKRIGVAIRKAGDDNVHTYRIPGIVTTDKGTLISVYDIRYKNSADLPGNIDVGMSRSTDGGKTWEPMKIIMDMGAPHENNGVGDPSILFDPVSKKIWVSALWSKGNRSIAGSQPGLSPDETGQFVLVSSDDDGQTWTKPYSITPQVKDPAWKLFFPGPGSGIAMQNGTIVFPAQYWDASHVPHSTLIYSDDHGKNWKSGIGAKSNTTESQLVETTPGTIMLNMRDNRGEYRSVATTTDYGKTWIEHATSYKDLIDPVCMASIIRTKTNSNTALKDVLFFSNVASKNARVDMTVKASLDLGETWLPVNSLLIDERRTYGYSSL